MSTGMPYPKVEAMAVAESNPDVLVLSVAAAAQGTSTMVLSIDGGQSWKVANSGLPRLDNRRFTALAFGKGGFYGGTDQGEIFLLNNMEGHWTLVASNLQPIRAMIALA